MQMLLFPRRMRYLWGRSVWWILLTGVSIMNVENELKHKACNIDLFAKKAIEDVAALGEYSSLLLDLANQIQMEIELLREQNKKLKEALEFYASGQHIDSISTGSSYSIRIEDGTKAKEAIKESNDG